jgi:pimeloyl-ACP methyl ester carboxylesterase
MSDRFKLRICTLLAIAVYSSVSLAQRFSQLATPTPLPPGTTLVIGFLGGYDRWNDEHRSVRRLVLRLRQRSGVYAESISNHHRGLAVRLIRNALDSNHNHRLDSEEIANSRVILFGQSWGGAATLDTARELEKLGVPVLLTVQVDSVGTHDDVVPRNVRAAANFYQHDLFTIVHGRRMIRAADPARTTILGNFEMSYASREVDLSNASMRRKTFGGSHTKMELDPLVWNRVEQYISDAITRRLP